MAYTGSLPVRYDDEDISFTISLTNADGTDFDFDAYTLEAAVSCLDSTVLTLTESSGISIDADLGSVLFSIGRLSAGRYAFACHAIEDASGDRTALLVISLPIAQGPF